MPIAREVVEAKVLEELPWLVSDKASPDPPGWYLCGMANVSDPKTAIIKESLRIGENILTRLPLISPIKPLIYQDWTIPPGVSTTSKDTALSGASVKETAPTIEHPFLRLPSTDENPLDSHQLNARQDFA